MKFFRPQGAEKDKPDRLFVVTARHKAMILEAEGGAGHNLEIVTKVRKVPIDVYYSYGCYLISIFDLTYHSFLRLMVTFLTALAKNPKQELEP